jgi:phasin
MIQVETPKKPAKLAAVQKPSAEKVEMPEVVRQFAETGVKQAKDAYSRMKTAAEETTDMLEDAYASATRGATELNLKALDALRANVNAGFDYARELVSVKSLSEAVELSASQIRHHFDALSAQARELSALAQKVAAETSEPIKSGVTKTFKAQ